jgi:hypothetical protein
MEEAQEGIHHHDHQYDPTRLIMDSAKHLSKICFLILFSIVWGHESSHTLAHYLIFPTDFIWKSRFFFLTSSPHPTNARYQDKELRRPNALFIPFSHEKLIVRRQVPPQEADLLHIFCESKWYWECRFSGYAYSHCNVRSYVEKQDRGYYGETELLCGDSIIKSGALYLYVWLDLLFSL